MDHSAAASDPPALVAERLTETSIAERLMQLCDRARIEQGGVTVIGLDAIRDRLGPKWPARRAWVWETVERHLQRRLGGAGFSVQLGDVEVAVCAAADPAVNRSLSLNLLRELLDFFLGSQRFEDMRLAQVVWVRGEEVGCAPIDPRKVEPLDESVSVSPAPSAAAATPPAGRPVWSTLSFNTADGRGLDLGLGFETVINLRNQAPVATRLRPLALERDSGDRSAGRWIEQLGPADQTAVIAAIGDAAAALYQASDVGLVIPCSIYTLSTCRNRALVREKMQAVVAAPTRPVIIELTDIDQGTPQGRLLEAVSLLAPHCRAVVARIGTQRPDAELLRAARLAGQSIDCTGLDGHELIGRISTASQARIGSLLFAFGLASDAAADLAAMAGATHGGMAGEPPPA